MSFLREMLLCYKKITCWWQKLTVQGYLELASNLFSYMDNIERKPCQN